jgi:polyketide biosynthesis acyl carrier protein
MNKKDIFALVVRHSREVIPELEDHEFKPGDRLADLGANSVDRADIIMMTMEALSLRVPRVELFGAKNIGELVNVFYEKLQSA